MLQIKCYKNINIMISRQVGVFCERAAEDDFCFELLFFDFSFERSSVSVSMSFSVVIVVMAPLAGWLSDRLGSRLLCTLGAAFIVAGQYFIASFTLESTAIRIMLPLLLTGLGWAAFNSPNQSAMLGSVPRDKIGAASGMSVTTARIGAATGTALSATLFTHGLASAGLSQTEIESPQAWGSAPEIFSQTFGSTVYIINFATLLAVFFSAVRGGRRGAA